MSPLVTVKRISATMCMCGPIIRHVVYCHAAQTDALHSISFQVHAVFAPSVATIHTHTHIEREKVCHLPQQSTAAE